MPLKYFIILLVLVLAAAGGGLIYYNSQGGEDVVPEDIAADDTEVVEDLPTPTFTVKPKTDREAVKPVTLNQTEDFSYGEAVVNSDSIYRYINSNGLPEHRTGDFPTTTNPNRITEQSHHFKVTLRPKKMASATPVMLTGVALNGIPLEPGTAEFYDHDPLSGWTEEAFFDGEGRLGIDWSNAHVQPDGTYHYHAVPSGLLDEVVQNQTGDLLHLAWAADGFPIYYSQSDAYEPSYQIKSGSRPAGPGGSYDGTYTEDYEYVTGLGDLDECNGLTIEGKYIYIITDTFPYIPRCVMGKPDDSFAKVMRDRIPDQPPAGDQGSDQEPIPVEPDGGTGAGAPPLQAISVCLGQSEGESCSFGTPQGQVSGQCLTPPGQDNLACVPQ